MCSDREPSDSFNARYDFSQRRQRRQIINILLFFFLLLNNSAI